jgi:thymidylate kinase
MTNPRKEFLSSLFRILDQKEIPYCVLRNYQNIYENTTSDIDLAVEPEQVLKVKQCLAEAAAASNHRFVLRARYVNYSYVYWHPAGGFIRIDLETEVRWRIFPVLTAKSIVGLRRREGAFYIPHPRHESVVLFVASIWRRNLSERYRQQLARLYQELVGEAPRLAISASGVTPTPLTAATGVQQLQRTFRAAFGAIGDKFAERQAHIANAVAGRGLWRAARRSLVRNAFRDAPTRRACLGYLISDARRLWDRLREPPGISLVFASSVRSAHKLEGLFEKIQFLYPSEKSVIHSFQITPGQRHSTRLTLRLKLARFFALFKGGLFIRFYGVAQDSSLPQVIGTRARFVYPSRTFVCVENSRFETYLAHEQSRFMAEFKPVDAAPIPDERIIQFISGVLEHHRRPASKAERARRGAWVVLVGLDGSGKTTVARQICCLGPEQQRFRKVRYFHWRPHLIHNQRLPLPDFDPVRRKPELGRNALRSLLSAARLCKNVFLANVAHQLRVRSWLRRNSLVLADRYYYNYFLDPVSVKYYGPPWLLEWARPFFPRPDLVVVLKVPAVVLLARKRELSRNQILQQNSTLNLVQFNARQVLELDATQPPFELARTILRKAAELT